MEQAGEENAFRRGALANRWAADAHALALLPTIRTLMAAGFISQRALAKELKPKKDTDHSSRQVASQHRNEDACTSWPDNKWQDQYWTLTHAGRRFASQGAGLDNSPRTSDIAARAVFLPVESI
jgi:hypothetical protein